MEFSYGSFFAIGLSVLAGAACVAVIVVCCCKNKLKCRGTDSQPILSDNVSDVSYGSAEQQSVVQRQTEVWTEEEGKKATGSSIEGEKQEVTDVTISAEEAHGKGTGGTATEASAPGKGEPQHSEGCPPASDTAVKSIGENHSVGPSARKEELEDPKQDQNSRDGEPQALSYESGSESEKERQENRTDHREGVNDDSGEQNSQKTEKQIKLVVPQELYNDARIQEVLCLLEPQVKYTTRLYSASVFHLKTRGIFISLSLKYLGCSCM